MNINDLLKRVEARLKKENNFQALMFFDLLFKEQFIQKLSEMNDSPLGWAEIEIEKDSWQLIYIIAAGVLWKTASTTAENYKNAIGDADRISEAISKEINRSVGTNLKVITSELIIAALEGKDFLTKEQLLSTDTYLKLTQETSEKTKPTIH